MKPSERWKILLSKAAQDEFTVDHLAPLPESSDEVIGFHLQQAAEKLLKALLSFRGIAYRRTHNIGELLHLIEKHGEIIPPEFDSLRDLTPYATEWRYDYIETEGQVSLDGIDKRKHIRLLRAWVESRIEDARHDREGRP